MTFNTDTDHGIINNNYLTINRVKRKYYRLERQTGYDILMVNDNSSDSPRQNNKYKAIIFKNRGYFHFRKEDYENSILNYKKAIEMDPNYSNAWCDLGLVYYTIGNIDEANECLDQLDSLKGNTKRKY